MSNDFTQRADLQVIRYAQVWEDHRVLERALQIGPEDDVLSICSAGCNALALLLAGARSVTAIDVSPAQAALLHLKLAAIQRLPYRDYLTVLGVAPGDALSCYAALRDGLDPTAREFWDARPEDLAAGVSHRGRLERYFQGFQREHLALLHDPAVIDQLMSITDPAAQGRYFEEVVATPAFCAAFRDYFGQQNLGSRGRDPTQLRYSSQQDVGAAFLLRLRALCQRTPLCDSPYMRYFLTGRHLDLADLQRHGAPALREENYDRLRALIPRVRVVLQDLGQHLLEQPAGTYSKANLSDIFEYMSEDATAALLRSLGERLRRGGRLAYWNLLVPRASGPAHAGCLRPLRAEADRLHQQDRIFFYQHFHIEEVVTP